MKLTGKYYHSVVFYDFKGVLSQEEYLQHLQLAKGDKVLSRTTIFRLFAEFHRGRSSVLDEEHT